ncbi:unnamed protein product [Rotaria sp. Silwood2]|nr:unnamed protein product [Rotaria sp. Silwood2]CAF4307226.1 unnamed protein product [Rotaria sp. Silwood2]
MASNKVILDVGGEKYTTSVDTLTAREKNTFFTELFARQWQLERDPKDDSIFIDRNGKLFAYILEYLRTGSVPNSVKNDELLRQSLVVEADYFRLQSLQNMLAKPTFPGNTLLESYQHKEKLNEFYGKPDQQWELIYKASRDGYEAKHFHAKCNGKGPTMTILQSTDKFLFGGYTTVPWSSVGSVKRDPQAFLFTLTNPHDISPTKYPIHPDRANDAMYHFESAGPCFGKYGASCDVSVSNFPKDTSYQNTISFPGAYIDTTGKGKQTFTGKSIFGLSDIEIFKLVN